LRRNFLYSPSHYPVGSFAVCAVNFHNKASQTEKVFDSEKCASCRDANEWILWPNVRPIKRHRRFASLRVEKENTTLTWQSPYVIYFKLDISVRMKRVNDPEGFAVKVLQGCSCMISLF
jgi:hypothetical protein